MGKGELWDDSALINAFDQAISNYNKMHGKGCKHVHGDVNADINETTSVITLDANKYNKSHIETADGPNDTSHAIVEVGEVQKFGTDEGNEGVNSQVSEKEHHSSTVVVDEYNQSSFDEYNQLYKEYYEVEEQRQRILERLQQFNSSTYTDAGEASVSSLQWGTDYTNKAYQSYASQVPCGCVVVNCCSCSCPYSLASKTNVHEKKPENVDTIKMAMGVVEKVVSSFKDKTDGLKEGNKVCSETEQSCSSETDLSVVLNAWFSAGFHTGKYLTEQSLAEKRPS